MKEQTHIHLNREGRGQNRRDEAHRLDLRQESDAAALNTGLKTLAAAMNSAKEDAGPGRTADPLLACCILVGKASGIEIQDDAVFYENDPLDAIARAAGIRYRSVTLDPGWWRRDSGPLLAFSRADNRPLALIPAAPGRYRCVDPAAGTRISMDRKLAETLSPLAVTFYRPFPAKPLKAADLVRFASRRRAGDLATLIGVGIIGALLGLVTPLVTGMIFDTVIPEASRSQMLQIAYLLLVSAVASALFGFTRNIAALRIQGSADAGLQAAVMDRLLGLPAAFFRNFSSGDLAQRAMGINAIRQQLSEVAVTAALSFMFSIFYFALLFKYSLKLALVALVLTLANVCITLLLAWLQIRNQRDLADIQGRISGMLLELLSGIAKLRITGTENRAFIRWAEAFGRQMRVNYRSGTLSNLMGAFTTAFPLAASMAIFYFVAAGRNTTLTTGSFMAFFAAYGSFQVALLQVCTAMMSVIAVIPLYERSKPILKTPPEISRDKKHPGKLDGALEVSHLNFRYTAGGPLVLRDISLEIGAGRFAAVVGSSGSGKSTLFRLLLGFETQESGGIYYDGQDIQTLDVREIRRQTGVVLQNSTLMPGDIFKNIIGASTTLTLEDAWAAAKMAGFDRDIKEMPMGMHTVLQAGGSSLSGGQKQRLMIARAIVHSPRILFFDEATSALDNQTQALVTESLEALQATRVVVAHRLSTIIHADIIFVLEQGQIVQRGTYSDLIARPGVFADLARRQML